MQAGDAIILNAANSCVGQLLVQLARVLGLRCIALIWDHGPQRFEKTSAWLRGLGATAVFAQDTFTQACAFWNLPSCCTGSIRGLQSYSSPHPKAARPWPGVTAPSALRQHWLCGLGATAVFGQDSFRQTWQSPFPAAALQKLPLVSMRIIVWRHMHGTACWMGPPWGRCHMNLTAGMHCSRL